jgi:hypothetical protein
VNWNRRSHDRQHVNAVHSSAMRLQLSRTFTRIATVHVSGEVFWWLSKEESFGWGARLTEEAAASLHTLLTPGLSGSQPYAALDLLERAMSIRIPIMHNHSSTASATAARDLDQKALPL